MKGASVLCFLFLLQWKNSLGSKNPAPFGIDFEALFSMCQESKDNSNPQMQAICQGLREGNQKNNNQDPFDLSSCTRLPPKPPSSSNPEGVSLFPLLEEGRDRLQFSLESEFVTEGILVLGNTGTGKTTVTQIIAGNLSRLHSVLTQSDTMVIVDDDDRIGQPSVVSKTLYPEFVPDNETGNVFIDCPGFDDTRGAEMDIAANFFMKTVTDKLSKVKLLFLVSSSSVRLGNDRVDFDRMVTHATKFVSNITELAPSIGLVVTKVESYQGRRFLSDESIMNGILEFLRSYNQSQYDNLGRLSVGEEIVPSKLSDYMTVLKKIEFIKAILVEDPDTEEFPKISFVRSPDICGSLDQVPSVSDSKERLQGLIERLNFTAIKQDDFGYTIKAETVLKVQEYAGTMEDQISEILNSSLSELQSFHYKNKVRNLIHRDVFEEISKDYGFLRSLISEEHTSRDDFFQKVEALFQQMQATDLLEDFQSNVTKLLNYLDFFDTVTGTVFNAGIPKWQREVDPFAEQLNLLRNWFRHVFTICASYDFQMKNPKPFDPSWPDYKVLNYLSDVIPNFVVPTSFPSVFQTYREVMVGLLNYCTTPVASELSPYYYGYRTAVYYSPFLKLSSVASSDLDSFKSIYLFAFEKLFIDTDLNLRGKGTKLFIIAPVWETVENHLITLDGENGTSVSPWKASTSLYRDGSDGKAGGKGGNAGSMFGIADRMTGNELSISAVGGTGGDGQEGGNGVSGQKGRSVSRSRFPLCFFHYFSSPSDMYSDGSKVYVVYNELKYGFNGEPGTAGGNGGNGGAAGEGGKTGQVQVLVGESKENPTTNKLVDVKVGDGNAGKIGQGGKGGYGGTYGNGMTCTKVIVPPPVCFWTNCNAIPPTRESADDGRSGCTGCSMLGKQVSYNRDDPVTISDPEKASSIKLIKEKVEKAGLPPATLGFLGKTLQSE